MKTYAAVSTLSGGTAKVDALNRSAYPYILTAYPFDKNRKTLPQITYPFHAMLDSGAFSAWSRSEVIDLDKYIEWVLAYAVDYPDMRVTNLDVIPGTKGQPPTEKEKKDAVRQSAENAAALRSAGLRVIEVHHALDDLDNLDKIVERRQPGEAIGLGGLSGIGASPKVSKLLGDAFFGRLANLCGWDKLIPVHGFGIARGEIGFRYPLASIDASTWVAPQMYGQVAERGALGVKMRRHDRNSAFLRNKPVASIYMSQLLNQWKEREAKTAAYWQMRGVAIVDEGNALVAH